MARSRPTAARHWVSWRSNGVGIARVGNFSIGDSIAKGRLVSLLEAFNPGDVEIFQAVFVGGANMPARIRVFVDYLVERLAGGPAEKPE